nr:unnamed protein product [Callosobruchus analis]
MLLASLVIIVLIFKTHN